MCGTSGSSALSVTASHEDTGQNLFWREKISFHTPKPKSPGQGHHGKTEEEPPMSCLFNRKGVFQLGTPLFSQRGCLGTRLHGHDIRTMATSGTAPFRRKATPHTGEPNFLYHDGSLITCAALQGQVLSQSLLHTNTQYRISFGEKRYRSKHPN